MTGPGIRQPVRSDRSVAGSDDVAGVYPDGGTGAGVQPDGVFARGADIAGKVEAVGRFRVGLGVQLHASGSFAGGVDVPGDIGGRTVSQHNAEGGVKAVPVVA